MEFEAEVMEVKSRKTVSLDLEYRIVLRTSNPNVLSLGAIDPSTLVKVEITPEGM